MRRKFSWMQFNHLFVILFIGIIAVPAMANYQSQAGRWMQQDPMQYVDGLNLYEYAASNSVMFIDPLGLTSTDALLRKQAKTIFSNIEDYFRDTDIYTVTGLSQFISKLSGVSIDKYKEGDQPSFSVSRLTGNTAMTLRAFSDRDLKRSLATQPHGDFIHEHVHAYLHGQNLFQADTFIEDRINEGAAYASQHIYEWMVSFRQIIEKQVEKLESNISKEERKKIVGLLKRNWPDKWSDLNIITKIAPVVTNIKDDKGNMQFIVNMSDVMFVKVDLGLYVGCNTIAERYNRRVRGLEGCECVEFKCKFGNPNSPEMWLKEPLVPVFE